VQVTMEFTPVKTRRLYEDIVEQIKQFITGGELKPGDKLLSERELAERLQVSRVSVREAIKALEMLGFVDIRPGDGTFVRDTNTDDIIRPLAMFLAVERNSLLDMFEVRRIFETATAGLAADRADAEEVEEIRTLLEKMKQGINLQDSEKGEEFDTAFHYAVAEATHNSLLIKLFRTVSEEFAKSISTARRQLFLDSTSNAQKIIDQHTRVYEAIQQRNSKVAAEAMLEHLTFAELELRKRLS
jgi:GntR family transcriptional repressor for pyruvate dehydrogenase complex